MYHCPSNSIILCHNNIKIFRLLSDLNYYLNYYHKYHYLEIRNFFQGPPPPPEHEPDEGPWAQGAQRAVGLAVGQCRPSAARRTSKRSAGCDGLKGRCQLALISCPTELFSRINFFSDFPQDNNHPPLPQKIMHPCLFISRKIGSLIYTI